MSLCLLQGQSSTSLLKDICCKGPWSWVIMKGGKRRPRQIRLILKSGIHRSKVFLTSSSACADYLTTGIFRISFPPGSPLWYYRPAIQARALSEIKWNEETPSQKWHCWCTLWWLVFTETNPLFNDLILGIRRRQLSFSSILCCFCKSRCVVLGVEPGDHSRDPRPPLLQQSSLPWTRCKATSRFRAVGPSAKRHK